MDDTNANNNAVDGDEELALAKPVYAASAVFAGFGHHEAAERIVAGISEPALGLIDPSKIQLCPQNPTTLNDATCAALVDSFPGTDFRIHANASCGGKFGIHDASSSWGDASFLAWKAQLNAACKALKAQAYSWHAGRAISSTLGQAISRTLDLEQELGIPVGMEGLYPSTATPWLMSSSEDYRAVMKSGAAFVVDLSHWQIVARSEGEARMDLLEELLAHPRCIEIHLSDNDSRRDNHQKLIRKPFWFSLLCKMQAKGLIRADVFSEGLQESRRPSQGAMTKKLY